jgi:hypothetical protein
VIITHACLCFDAISSRALLIGGSGEANGWFQATVVCVKLHVMRPALPLKLQKL